MDITKYMNTKTVLEHLVFLSNKNTVTVCRELQITPQQFTDWVKIRRPIPAERLDHLSKYFIIPMEMIADQNRFAKKLSVLNRLDLELLIASKKSKHCHDVDEKSYLLNKIEELEIEKKKQLRIARLAVILESGDESILQKVDELLNNLEKKNSTNLGGQTNEQNN